MRWIELTDDNQNGIRILAQEELLGFSAHHQYNADFDEGKEKINRHPTDIIKRDIVNLNIDYKQMGVGGDNSWGAQAHDQYQIKPNERLIYGFVISPIRDSE